MLILPVNLAGEKHSILTGKYPIRRDSGEANSRMFFSSRRRELFLCSRLEKNLWQAICKKRPKQYNMKTKIVTLGTALLFASVIAQAQKGQIRAGLNLANVSVTNNGRVDDANQLTSFQVGLLTDIKLGNSFLFLQPGILYTGKGAKVQKGTAAQAGYFKQTFNPMYLEVPVNLLVKAPLGASSHFFVGAGPYLAMGVAGKTKTEGTNLLGTSYNYERSITFSNDDPTTFNEEEGTGFGVVRRFDYGLNGTAGIEGKSLALGVNYGLGMAKLQSGSNSSADNNNKSRVLSVTLGFKF